jgi:hypothetical protein
MTAPPPPKIYCLFHRKTDCICISPVTDRQALKMRLESAIRLNEINNKFESSESEKARRDAETEEFRRRLAEISG